MKASEILTQARMLVEEPSRWTQKVRARDEQGKRCDPSDEKATCFCAMGAIDYIEGPLYAFKQSDHVFGLSFVFLRRAAREITVDMRFHEPDIVYVNDELGHDATIQMFDMAIAFAQVDEELSRDFAGD